MPLTPADVRNKQFSTTRLRPGYDEEEVDAFLDEVETELDRLIGENEELRAKLAECLRGGKSAVPALSSPLSDPKPDMMAPEPRMEQERRQPEPMMMGGMPHIED
jgi:DivIVA domain-containing protein